MPDLKMPDGIVVSFPDDWSKEQIQEVYYKKYPDKNPLNQGNEFTRGLKRGAAQSSALITEGIPALAKDLIGDDEGAQENFEEYSRKVSEATKKNPKRIGSYTEIDGLADAGSYVASILGEQGFNLGASLLGGGAGGFAGKRIAQKKIKDATESQIKKGISRGITAGALTTSASQNVPETYFNLLEQGSSSPYASLAVGGLKSGLDALPAVKILERIMGPNANEIVGNTLLKRMGSGAAIASVQEGATETAQEGLDLLAEKVILDKQLNTPENIERLINAGLAGAISGGAIGGATAPFALGERPQFDYNNLDPKVKSKLDAQFGEEVIGDAPLSDNVLVPTYLDSKTLNDVARTGVNLESLSNLSLEETKFTQDALQSIQGLSSLSDLLNIQKTPQTEVNIETLAERRKEIDNNERKDVLFEAGDGQVVTGAPINTEQKRNILETTKELKVDNVRALENSIKKPVPINDIKLPKDLKNAKPRYKTSKLNFDNDLDKAIYIVGNKKSKSKADDKYSKFLKEDVGLTDPEINSYFSKMKDVIKEIENNIDDTADTINVPPSDFSSFTPKLQRGAALPKYGNVRDDLVTPTIISENLSGIQFSDKAITEMAPMLQSMQRILNEVAGPKAQLVPFERLFTGPLRNEPVHGAQLMNYVAVALNESTVTQIDDTLYHEAWHYMERNQVFSDNEIKAMNASTEQLLNYMNQDEYLRGQDFQVYLASPKGREELRANAFGKYAQERRINETTNNVPTLFKRYFNRALNFIRKTGSMLKGNGFNSLDDIFASVYEGRRAKDVLDEINYTNQVSRLQRMGESFQRAHQAENNNETTFKENVESARKASNNDLKTIGFYSRYLRSMQDMASANPMMAQLYDSMKRKMKRSAMYLEDFIGGLNDFQNQDKAVRYKLHDLAVFFEQTDQMPSYDLEARMTYVKDGKLIRIKDPKVGELFKAMQESYAKVPEAYLKEIKRKAYNRFADLLPNENFTLTDLEIAKAQLDPETQTKKVEAIERLEDTLKSHNNMQGRVYVPHMRFGQYGITVREKESGEQVGFYTIENGTFGGLFNEFQLNETADILNKKYSDTSKYEVIGDNGVIKTFTKDNIKPFKLTHNILKDKIDPRFMTLELLSSLMDSKNIDDKAYAQLKDNILEDTLMKGFARRFSHRKDIEGFSRDWDRVQHGYFSGASNFLSGLQQREELAIFDTEITKLNDPKLESLARAYLDYNGSLAEDQQMLRAFNFMWTMGANISTAALQVMTLPTTTLGSMSQYNPNPLQNMREIGRWFWLSKEFFPSILKTVQTHNGLLYADFRNDAVISRLIKQKRMTEKEAEFLYKVGQEFRGFLTEEYSGFTPFETRSLGGSVREKMGVGANLLGMPISVMEQMTRFATAMAHFSVLNGNAKALKRAEKVLGNDPRFQVQIQNSDNNFGLAENVALFGMDEAHGVFGKLGRPSIFKSVGGSLIFPFMTYPQQALEFIIRANGRGPEGIKASMMTVGSLFVFAGAMGLPGVELLKELYEELEKQVTGSEEDLELLIREKLYAQTGEVTSGKFLTQGIGRAFGDLDVSGRIGLPIVGQDILFNILGIQGESKDLLGVSGSFLGSLGQAWTQYNNDSPITTVASSLLPVAPSNVLKGMVMDEEGVSTRKGVQLLTPEEVSLRTQAARMVGIGTDEVASRRERLYYKMLQENRFKVGLDRYREKARKSLTKMIRAQEKEDWDTVKEAETEYENTMTELGEFVVKNEIPLDVSAFNRSVKKSVLQRLTAQISPKDVRKVAREKVFTNEGLFDID